MPPPGLTTRQVSRLRRGELSPGAPADQAVAVEEPLEIRVASEPIAVTMRTPGQDDRLAVGFLFSEGVVTSIDDVASVVHCGRPGEEGTANVVDVVAAPGVVLDADRLAATRRGTLTTSACGVCGRRTIDDLVASSQPLEDGDPIPLELLTRSTEELAAAQATFGLTGGVHAAAAFDAGGGLLAVAEDVGRHNAVDKVVGALLYDNRIGPGVEKARRPCVLAVSGRASFEIVQKAARAGVPAVVAISAATSLAIDLATRVGLTLAGFSRGGELAIYSGLHRVAPGRRRP